MLNYVDENIYDSCGHEISQEIANEKTTLETLFKSQFRITDNISIYPNGYKGLKNEPIYSLEFFPQQLAISDMQYMERNYMLITFHTRLIGVYSYETGVPYILSVAHPEYEYELNLVIDYLISENHMVQYDYAILDTDNRSCYNGKWNKLCEQEIKRRESLTLDLTCNSLLFSLVRLIRRLKERYNCDVISITYDKFNHVDVAYKGIWSLQIHVKPADEAHYGTILPEVAKEIGAEYYVDERYTLISFGGVTIYEVN